MKKLIDKYGWKKAALWTGGAVAYVGWAAQDIYTHGWKMGLGDAAAVGITAGLCLWVWRQRWPWEPPTRTDDQKNSPPPNDRHPC